MKPSVMKTHEAGVEDIQWSPKNNNIVGCGCQDKTINM